MFRGYINNERGVSLILMGLSIIVLFGFGALAIDIAHIYNVKNQLQVAADAAALAGANELDESQTGRYDPGSVQDPARQAASRVALKNTASVAENDIASASLGLPGCNFPIISAGNPIPVGLRTAQNPGSPPEDRDIEVGHWSGDAFVPVDTNNGTVINAVRITARRGGTGSMAYQPRVATWFAKIFALLPGGTRLDFTNIAAQAVAARDTIDILPIAVNEYWDESGGGGTPVWGQTYPQSFMRQTNIDGTASTIVGKSFAIIGQNANPNPANSMSINGYVDILYRSRFHDGRNYSFGNFTSWFRVQQISGTTGTCSPNCEVNLNPITVNLSGGNVNTSAEENLSFPYLFSGVPGNTIVPNAVREYDTVMGRTAPFNLASIPTSYGTHIFNGIDYTNDPQVISSDPNNDRCPLATIPYFDKGGFAPLNQRDTVSDQYFHEKYPQGTRFMVMVYDGSHDPAFTTGPNSSPDRITVIGYGLIEVDGYLPGGGNWDGSQSSLRDKGNTCYGHAVPYRDMDPASYITAFGLDPSVVDVSDPYLVQPPHSDASGNKTLGSCGFSTQVRKVVNSLNYVHLVGRYSIRYGVMDHAAP